MRSATNSTTLSHVTLGNIAEVKLGKMLDRSKHKLGRSLPYLRNINVRWGTFDTSSLLEMFFKDEKEEAKFSIKKNDVLVCEGGEPGRAAVWTREDTDLKFQKALHRVRFIEPYEPKLLVYFLELAATRGELEKHFTGSTIKHFTKQAFVQLKVPNPPLPEQRRIVAKIEELFSKLDAGVDALKKAKAQLKRYRQSVLAAAVTGELTKEWREANPDTEPASELLERILKQRREQWNGKRKYKEPTPPVVENLSKLPTFWTWASPDQLSAAEDYSLAIGPFGSNLKVSDYTDSGVPLVFVRHIRSNNYDLTEKFVSHQKAIELKAHSVDPGDLLITKMGEPPGDAALYPEDRPHAIITADCIKLRLTSAITCKSFFVNAINSKLIAEQITPRTRGVAQKKISLDRFRDVAFPLPPLIEQQQIIAETEARLTSIDHVESELDQQLLRASKLRQSILSNAFNAKI
ncbi:restriction endonuclease subunit S [Coraliomargarita algicola]|uniref:Restriction endonuclease subunit S n=1 Tax=Coraliomargarita algicola TaxID=3092156 RepID=A0ABZ0RMS8_9BACT|nr:restriction endonuclease subunit S [Coraliomargarita sp. J2-16]WPJ97529.1 restriction endonuclease subunit S [Coraliomargarita sp. J2-16]